jgi:hypothetical protein
MWTPKGGVLTGSVSEGTLGLPEPFEIARYQKRKQLMIFIRANGVNYVLGMIYEYQSLVWTTAALSLRYISDTTAI